MITKKCYAISTHAEVEEIVKLKIDKNDILIIFIKNYLITGFGIEWLRSFIQIIRKKYNKHNIKFYVDGGTDYGLSILILEEDINYLKLRSNKVILEKINQIAKKNKVLLNPSFNVVRLKKKQSIKI